MESSSLEFEFENGIFSSLIAWGTVPIGKSDRKLDKCGVLLWFMKREFDAEKCDGGIDVENITEF